MHAEPSVKKTVTIVGAGGLAREIAQWITDINKLSPKWTINGFIDDSDGDPLAGTNCSLPLLGTIRDWQPSDNEYLVIGIANPAVKARIIPELKARGARFASVVHPSAYVADDCALGDGVIVYPHTIVSVNTIIGDFVTLLTCSVAHDVRIGSYSTVSTYCEIRGRASLGEAVFFGSYASVTPGHSVGDGAFICPGSLVDSDVPSGAKLSGNPAQVIL